MFISSDISVKSKAICQIALRLKNERKSFLEILQQIFKTNIIFNAFVFNFLVHQFKLFISHEFAVHRQLNVKALSSSLTPSESHTLTRPIFAFGLSTKMHMYVIYSTWTQTKNININTSFYLLLALGRRHWCSEHKISSSCLLAQN